MRAHTAHTSNSTYGSYDEATKVMLEMGFEPGRIRRVLVSAHGNLDHSMDTLLAGSDEESASSASSSSSSSSSFPSLPSSSSSSSFNGPAEQSAWPGRAGPGEYRDPYGYAGDEESERADSDDYGYM